MTDRQTDTQDSIYLASIASRGNETEKRETSDRDVQERGCISESNLYCCTCRESAVDSSSSPSASSGSSTGGAGSTDSADVNAANTLLANVPNQPMSTDSFPVQVLSGRTLVFQTSWYKKFPWLHYSTSSDTNGILCFVCVKAAQLNLLGLVSK